MDRQIRLFLNGGSDHIDIFSFEYNAQRMGGAPTITATINHYDILDINNSCWCQFVDVNGNLGEEKFFVRNEPSKTKTNEDARYKYAITFVSERDILDNVFFIDASQSSFVEGKVVSKGVEFSFSGNVVSYVEKLNAALSLSQVNGYSVVVDESILSQDISKVEKFFSISRASFTSAFQEIYNQYDIPYYFVGKTCHVGYFNEDFKDVKIQYGSNDALIQISKSSKSNKVVTRCSGVGSQENLPSYYPNQTQTGRHEVVSCTGNITKAKIQSIDYEKISSNTNLRDGATLTFKTKSPISDNINNTSIEYYDTRDGWYNTKRRSISGSFAQFDTRLEHIPNRDLKYKYYSAWIYATFYAERGIIAYGTFDVQFSEFVPNATATYAQQVKEAKITYSSISHDENGTTVSQLNGNTFEFVPKSTGKHILAVKYEITLNEPLFDQNAANYEGHYYPWCGCVVNFKYATSVQTTSYMMIDGAQKTFPINECGVVFVGNFEPSNDSTIVLSESIGWMQPQSRLMPTIYRATLGEERFYNAINGGYETDTDEKYNVKIDDNTFVNEYNDSHFCEHIADFEDIKPTIKECVNKSTGLRMDIFSEFDRDRIGSIVVDNDEMKEDGNLKHPYFYAKLRKLDFNLFDHALPSGEVTFSFTTGNCAPCKFVMQVDENTKKNTLQVDVNGDIIFDSNGDAKFSVSNPQDRQNDTSKYEVWIALKKEKDTYGEWRPNNVFYPKASLDDNTLGDSFVITNINLPYSYITNAEKKLEQRIIEYMKENNLSGYNFDVKFSRIFLEENKETFTSFLSENSRLTLMFQGSEYKLYVNGLRYKIGSDDSLPEISVTISDSLQISKSGISTLVSSVKSDVLAAVHNIDVMPTIARYAIRKDQDDTTTHHLTTNGLTVNGDVELKDDVEIGGDVVIGGASKINNSITIGDFNSVIGSINGGRITHEGDASFRSIRANYLEVMALVYNQIKASSSYTVFDDTGTITDIQVEEVDGNKVYTLTFEESELSVKNENGLGVQSFVKDDIVHGRVNNINNYEFSRAGECWMKIVEVPSNDNDLKDNQVKALLYDDASVPAPPNLEPTVNMTVAHQGNETDKRRQCTFYISSKDGNIIQLLDVDRPKLYNAEEDGYSNYGVVIGTLPPDLFQYVKDYFAFVTEKDPVVYARYGIFENLLQLDYLGRPIKTANFRGEWNLDTALNDPYRVTSTTYDTVTHDGSWWECRVDGSTIEPSVNTTHWLLVVSKGSDSSVVSYSIKPSSNVIYFNTNDGTLSSNHIDIKIGEDTALGHHEIDSNDELIDRELTLWYSIDGGELFEFNLSDSALFELENDNGVIDAEDGSSISLEGTDIDTRSISDNITLYLKDSNSVTRALVVIPFIKAGSFKSTVFTRDTTLLVDGYIPQGGTYYSPIPTDKYTTEKNGEIIEVIVWHDSIPEGTSPVYSSTATFYGDGTHDDWSEPKLMSDTSDFEVIYSPSNFSSVSDARDSIPSGFGKSGIDINEGWLVEANAEGWYDEDFYVDDNGATVRFEPIWMATNSRHAGGEWRDEGWVVTKIKGENINKNLIQNSNFDNFIDGVPEKWSLYVLEMPANLDINGTKEGQNVLRVYSDSGRIRSNQFLMEANTVYTFSMYVYVASADDACVSITVPKKSTYITENATLVSQGEGTKAKTASFSANSANTWLKIVIHIKTVEESYDKCVVLLGGADGDTLYSMPKMEYGNVATTYFPATEDFVGPAGKAGPILYPEGEWVAKKRYEKTNDSTPFVYFDEDKTDDIEGIYYILESDYVESDKSPAEDTKNWRPMTKYEAIYTKFIMANFAKFGGENGGVFYDKYLFSQKGKNANGEEVSYNKDSIVDNEFSEDFSPNLSIDFKNGKLVADDAIVRGRIEATSGLFSGGLSSDYGHVGPMRIGTSSVAVTGEGSGTKSQIVMNPFIGLSYRGEVEEYGLVTNCSFGVQQREQFIWVTDPDGTETAIPNAKSRHGIAVEAECKSNKVASIAAMYISMSGTALKNYAISCPNGQFSGLRTNTKVIPCEYSNYSVDWKEHHVLIVKTSDIDSIQLSINNDKDGAELIIESRISTVYIDAVDTPVYSYTSGEYFVHNGYLNVRESDNSALTLSKGVWLMKRYNQYTGQGEKGEWSLYPLYK